jgi:phosphoenolpyruvate carboxykinase (GTP)
VPAPEPLDVDGLDLDPPTSTRSRGRRRGVARRVPQIEEWFAKIGDQLPTGMRDELDALRLRLG